MATTRSRRSIAASLTLAGAAAAVLTLGSVAQAATEIPTDKTPVIIEDTFTGPQIAQDTIAPVDPATHEADPAADPTLHQTPEGTWYYADTLIHASEGQMETSTTDS